MNYHRNASGGDRLIQKYFNEETLERYQRKDLEKKYAVLYPSYTVAERQKAIDEEIKLFSKV